LSFFKCRIGEIAKAQGLDYKALTAKLKAVDPTGKGLNLTTVSSHMNLTQCDRIDGRLAYLYCTALDCEVADLWELIR